jgi:2-polyprenyl-6-methoxyphenol hydroxylase-like FAD-dependent oxidoreductase
MQNKQMSSSPICQPGALLLGDAFNMRHPLTGGGMTVALSDVKLLCDMLHPVTDFTNPNLTAAATRSFFTQRKPLSATINTLANALYNVFRSTGSAPHEEMRQVRLATTSVLSLTPCSQLSTFHASILNDEHAFTVMHRSIPYLLPLITPLKPPVPDNTPCRSVLSRHRPALSHNPLPTLS